MEIQANWEIWGACTSCLQQAISRIKKPEKWIEARDLTMNHYYALRDGNPTGISFTDTELRRLANSLPRLAVRGKLTAVELYEILLIATRKRDAITTSTYDKIRLT